MFEYLFKYPWAMYRKGELILLRGWPLWSLLIAVIAAGAFVAWIAWTRRDRWKSLPRTLALAALQWGTLALLLVLLWQPALSVSALQSQQNVVAVVVDTSESMSEQDGGGTRLSHAQRILNSGWLDRVRSRYRVRLYGLGASVTHDSNITALKPDSPATHISDALQEIAGESATTPIGAVVLMSDGSDNAGGLDPKAVAAIKQTRIPIHAVGFGRETLEQDVEVVSVQGPSRTLAHSRVSFDVTLRQAGFAKAKARLSVTDNGRVVASRDIQLPDNGQQSTEAVSFDAGEAAARTLQIRVDPLPNERNRQNNAVAEILNVEDRKPRILYLEGEPRWELKFIRRAVEDDKNLDLVSVLRTTQNKLYRQGIQNPSELEDGFPSTVEELFNYQALIFGSVEAAYLTPSQLNLVKEFADRRGGGVLFLGGRASLSEGGWQKSSAAEMLPVTLPDRKNTFRRDPAKAELTPRGRESLLTRLADTPEANAARWASMPPVGDYQDVGEPKPGATVLLNLLPSSGGRLPLLVTQNYGRGRVGVFATGASWKWQMLQDAKDMTHEVYWRQLLRWLAGGTQGRVISSTSRGVYEDESAVPLHAEVRDTNYMESSDAVVEAHIVGPGGRNETVSLQPDPQHAGQYNAEWRAPAAGSYLAEIVARRGDQELGRDVVTFLRQDGVAEHFRREQNRELLTRLAEDTGGRYYRPDETNRLLDEISFSEAGFSSRENHDIWDAPFFFLLLFLMKSGEWLLRRRWGAV